MPISLASKLKKAGIKEEGSLWNGPCGDGPNGGVTQSLISRFLCCRERFRLMVVLGLKPFESFNVRMEYGNFWHVCEEAVGKKQNWQKALNDQAQKMVTKYRTQQTEIVKWYKVCLIQFPIALAYWKKHPEKIKHTPILAEQVFDVPYILPSGRTVRLRGKWDGASLCQGPTITKGLYIDEHKSKSDPKKDEIARQLKCDLQTMTYAVALEQYKQTAKPVGLKQPLVGVRYNVIKRPLSGGKGSITAHKEKNPKKGKYVAAETDDQFMARLGKVIKENESEFFHRWTVEFSPNDLQVFQDQVLIPILEQMCDWWDWISYCTEMGLCPFASVRTHGVLVHWRHPFGVYNSVDERGSSDVDEFLESGNMVGLRRATSLFQELQV